MSARSKVKDLPSFQYIVQSVRGVAADCGGFLLGYIHIQQGPPTQAPLKRGRAQAAPSTERGRLFLRARLGLPMPRGRADELLAKALAGPAPIGELNNESPPRRPVKAAAWRGWCRDLKAAGEGGAAVELTARTACAPLARPNPTKSPSATSPSTVKTSKTRSANPAKQAGGKARATVGGGGSRPDERDGKAAKAGGRPGKKNAKTPRPADSRSKHRGHSIQQRARNNRSPPPPRAAASTGASARRGATAAASARPRGDLGEPPDGSPQEEHGLTVPGETDATADADAAVPPDGNPAASQTKRSCPRVFLPIPSPTHHVRQGAHVAQLESGPYRARGAERRPRAPTAPPHLLARRGGAFALPVHGRKQLQLQQLMQQWHGGGDPHDVTPEGVELPVAAARITAEG